VGGSKDSAKASVARASHGSKSGIRWQRSPATEHPRKAAGNVRSANPVGRIRKKRGRSAVGVYTNAGRVSLWGGKKKSGGEGLKKLAAIFRFQTRRTRGRKKKRGLPAGGTSFT